MCPMAAGKGTESSPHPDFRCKVCYSGPFWSPSCWRCAKAPCTLPRCLSELLQLGAAGKVILPEQPQASQEEGLTLNPSSVMPQENSQLSQQTVFLYSPAHCLQLPDTKPTTDQLRDLDSSPSYEGTKVPQPHRGATIPYHRAHPGVSIHSYN